MGAVDQEPCPDHRGAVGKGHRVAVHMWSADRPTGILPLRRIALCGLPDRRREKGPDAGARPGGDQPRTHRHLGQRRRSRTGNVDTSRCRVPRRVGPGARISCRPAMTYMSDLGCRMRRDSHERSRTTVPGYERHRSSREVVQPLAVGPWASRIGTISDERRKMSGLLPRCVTPASDRSFTRQSGR